MALAIALSAVSATTEAQAGSGSPLITPTAAEYPPGQVATILGYEFGPGEPLTIRITRPDGSVVKSDGTVGSDSVVADANGHFSYDYDALEFEGIYDVAAIDASRQVCATTRFADNILTDMQTAPMELISGRGGQGLTDAIAGRCLVFFIEIRATGGDTLPGFEFDLVIDRLSAQQDPPATLLPFIDQLETLTAGAVADPQTGNAETGGTPAFYQTTSTVLSQATTPMITSLDGTVFEVVSGPVMDSPSTGQDTYRIRIAPASTSTNPADLTGAIFEFCARINVNAGDDDTGTDGSVQFTPESGGTETTPINVIQLEGACCLPDGSCEELTTGECSTAGGVYQGDLSECDQVDCPQPVGACCFDDGSCTDLTEADCTGQGGTYQGDGTDCATTVCPVDPVLGACCFDDGSCENLTEAECQAASGMYQGDFTDCASTMCPLPQGACCLPDGNCRETDSARCISRGGVYQGDSTLCIDVDCPQPSLCEDTFPNVALNKPVIVSSQQASPQKNTPAKLVNGNTADPKPFYSTKFNAFPVTAETQWVDIDLETFHTVCSVKVYFERCAAVAYCIQVSRDRCEWETVADLQNLPNPTKAQGGRTDTIELGNGAEDVRFVRVLLKESINGMGYAIWEIEVFGFETPAPIFPEPINWAQPSFGATAWMSSLSLGDPENFLDCDMDTSAETIWENSANAPDPLPVGFDADKEWFEVDLGMPRTFDRIEICWDRPFAVGYKIQYFDGVWQDIFSVAGLPGDAEGGDGSCDEFSFPEILAQRVRVETTLRDVSYDSGIHRNGYALSIFKVIDCNPDP